MIAALFPPRLLWLRIRHTPLHHNGTLLVQLALFIASAFPIQCYTCDSGKSNEDCMNPANCYPNQIFCMTTVIGFGGFGVITKNCLSCCHASSSSFIFIGKSFCCTTNLCNVSRAFIIKSTYTIFIAALGLLGALLKCSPVCKEYDSK